MKGIGYIVDEKGNRKALVIGIKYARFLEDFLDGLSAEHRKKESKRGFNAAVSRILRKKKG